MNELTFDKEYKVLKRRDVSVGEEIELSEDEIYFVRYRNKIIISPLKGRYLMDKLMRTKFSFPISMMNVYSERGALVPLDIEGPLQVIKGRKTGALE